MAQFRIDQDTLASGTIDQSRVDLVPDQVVTLTAVDPVPGPGVSFAWEVVDRAGAQGVLSSTAGTSVTMAASYLVTPCSYLVKLTANNNGVITTSLRKFCVVGESGVVLPLLGESTTPGQTLSSNTPNTSTDNALYQDRAGTGVAEQNWRGWTELLHRSASAAEAAYKTAAEAAGNLVNMTSLVGYLSGRVSTLEEAVPPSPVLWKWNAMDTTQFMKPHDQISGGSASLSVVTGTRGPALRVTFPTKTTGSNAFFATISDVSLWPNSNNITRYRLSFRLVNFSGNSAEWSCVGPAFCCNAMSGSNFYGFAVGARASSAGAGRYARVQGGTQTNIPMSLVWAGNTFPYALSGGSYGLLVEYDVDILFRKVDGSPPMLDTKLAARTYTEGAPIYTSFDNTYAIANLGAYGTGWNSADLTTCGLMILGTTGTTAGQYFEFDNFVITKHPADM